MNPGFILPVLSMAKKRNGARPGQRVTVKTQYAINEYFKHLLWLWKVEREKKGDHSFRSYNKAWR
jgi:hypothetical protein